MRDDQLPPTGSSPLGASAAHTRRRRALQVVAWTAAGVLLIGGAGASYLYYRLNSNIHSVDISTALGHDRPAPLANGATDILVLGSDSRSGPDSEYGRNSGTARSDTAMVVHLDKGRRSGSVVSIPRDTLVARPACTGPGGIVQPAVPSVMFNTAYQVGGPVCAVKTVERLTGLRMDHYVEVDFTGFKHVVNALNGVPLTTLRAINDPMSHLDLPAGTHTLNGDQALGLVRTRHGVADGSDLGRIELQQAFMKALVDRISRLGVLGDPTKLFSVADTATRAVTTDSGLGSVDKLMGLAQSVQHLSSSQVTTVTLPVRYAVSDPNRVEPIGDRAAMVWAALKAGRPIPPAATKGSVAENVAGGGVVGAAPVPSPSPGAPSPSPSNGH